ncbi:hypothetical protein ABZ611_12960 [Streptomyces sp. NPDC007861]|uniref:hypothetical protein n=1 Tax=Streptomyces sp. NPDC007861 TaxID=3154893 RepID=UPI003400C679
MNATDPQLVLTPVPPGPAAGSKVTLRLDFRLHRQPVTQIALSLPVGGEETDLLADENACRGVKTRLGTDEYTKSDKSKAPVWQIDGGKLIGKAWTYTLTPAKGFKTDHLTLTLADISLNSKPSDKNATANAAITASVAIDGQGTKSAAATILKSGPGLALDNFCATGNRKGEDQNNPVMVLAGRPFRLTWTAKDADSFNLAWGTNSVNLPGSQRSYPPDPADTKVKLAIKEATSFKLTAHNTNTKDPDATKQIFLTVPKPDGEYTDLTVTGKLTPLPPPKPTTHTYWLNSKLTLTAGSDGYYSINLTTYRRLLGVFPPTPAKYAEPTTITIQSPDHDAVSFTAGNTETPLTIFAAKGTVISLAAAVATIDDWTRLPQAVVTWTGRQPDSATLPTSYGTFPSAEVKPLYEDFINAKWSYRDPDFQATRALPIYYIEEYWIGKSDQFDHYHSQDRTGSLTITGSATPCGAMGVLAWLTNKNKITIMAYGEEQLAKKVFDGGQVTGYDVSCQSEKANNPTLEFDGSRIVGIVNEVTTGHYEVESWHADITSFQVVDYFPRNMTTLCRVKRGGNSEEFNFRGEYHTAPENSGTQRWRIAGPEPEFSAKSARDVTYKPHFITADPAGKSEIEPTSLPSSEGWESPLSASDWINGATHHYSNKLYISKDGIFANGELLTPEGGLS